MLQNLSWRVTLAGGLLCVAAPCAFAAVVLNGTRVVYASSEREVTLKLSNEGNTPALVQAWIDDGDPNSLPEEAKVPFALTPPLFRVDSKKGQSLRIIYTKEPLPKDRESLFWLNVLEVPPLASTSQDSTNSLQVAFRTRVKLFFRPVDLHGDAGHAPAKAKWAFVRKDNGSYVLTATNPTPYYVTYSLVVAKAGSATYSNDKGGMAPPGETVEFDIGQADSVRGESPQEVEYTTVNDYGAGVTGVYHANPKP